MSLPKIGLPYNLFHAKIFKFEVEVYVYVVIFYTNCFPDIYGIYATNTFEQGVGIQASRFNHSCRSNAEEFWNEKYGATEIRSVSKINAGEEITINYRTSEISMKCYKTR